MVTSQEFSCAFVLNNDKKFLIWRHVCDDEREGEGDHDKVIADSCGHIPIFRALDEVQDYARLHELNVDCSSEGSCNFDVVIRSLRRSRPKKMPCEELLEVWNLLGDVSRTVGGNFDPDRERTDRLYGKAFWGSNIPALTPPGCHFEPVWTRRDLRLLRETFAVGLGIFREHTRLWKT